MQAVSRAGASGEKNLSPECCGLACGVRLSCVWHISIRGYVCVVTGVDNLRVSRKAALHCLCS